MKNFKILLVMIVAALGFNSCEKDELVFTAQEPAGTFSFTNTFLDEYILTSAASSNIGERFTWESVSFNEPIAVAYDLQGSLTSDFADIVITKSTSGNDVAVTIGNLLSMAELAGLDNDPNTEAPNTGTVYFRLKAYAGNNAIETISTVQALTLFLPEIVDTGGGYSISSWGVVGDAYNNWGAFDDSPFYTTDQANVLVAYVTLVDGKIKFRENNLWESNLGDNGNDGTLEAGGADIPITTAGTYKITLNLNNNTYTMEEYSWGIVGSGYNNWGGAYDHDNNPATPDAVVPDAKFYYDYTTDTFKVGVKLIGGEIKFRLNNDWGVNLGDTGGVLVQDGGNISVTEGYYVISINLNDNTYTMEEPAEVWGVVGSAAVNGWGGPDFRLTEINPGILFGDIVTLSSPNNDSEIKFRVNDDWGINLGDDGTGQLVQDGGNIKVVDGTGDYRVYVNLNDSTYWIGKIR